VKVREARRIVSVAVIIASPSTPTDAARSWAWRLTPPRPSRSESILRRLTRRGLRGVQLAHEGLKAAAAKVLHASWQRCRIHVLRNLLPHIGPGQRAMVAAAIRTVFTQENQDAARRQWRQVADGLRERFERLAKAMDEAEDDVLAYMTFHPDHWTRISPTNPLERLIGEIIRRTDVVGISPNDGRDRALGRRAAARAKQPGDPRRLRAQ
jgi:putative transposase